MSPETDLWVHKVLQLLGCSQTSFPLSMGLPIYSSPLCGLSAVIYSERVPKLSGFQHFTVITSIFCEWRIWKWLYWVVSGSGTFLPSLVIDCPFKTRKQSPLTVLIFSQGLETRELVGSLGTIIIWFPEEAIPTFLQLMRLDLA